MLRHVVMFRWKPEATQQQKETVAAELSKLPPVIGSIRAYVLGADAGLGQGNFEFAVTADFDGQAGWAAYRDDPAHRAVVDKHILPILAERAAVQFEY
jgi:hypothetical protein